MLEKIKETAIQAINKKIDWRAKEEELLNICSPDEHWIQMDDTGEIMQGVGEEVDRELQEWIGHQEGYKQAMEEILSIINNK